MHGLHYCFGMSLQAAYNLVFVGRYLVELESHPDIWFRYNMYKYLDNAVAQVANFMGIDPEDTFLLQNVTKGMWSTILCQSKLNAVCVTQFNSCPSLGVNLVSIQKMYSCPYINTALVYTKWYFMLIFQTVCDVICSRQHCTEDISIEIRGRHLVNDIDLWGCESDNQR